MKNTLTLLVLLNVLVLFGQKETKSNISIEDGIFSNAVRVKHNLSDKWSIGAGLESSYNSDAKSISIPFGFKYEINQKLNVFADYLFYTSKNTNTERFTSQKTFNGTATRFGGQYKFTENIKTKVFYKKNYNAKENYESRMYNFKNTLNLNFGIRF